MYFWCHRCRRKYRSLHAFHQHLRDSPSHHLCPECKFDGIAWDDLLQHCRTEGCRRVCQGCDDGRGLHWSVPGYSLHLRVNNVCTDCERHFTSPSHLYQHRLSHRTKVYECYNCPSRFKTYSGMIIHLEYGTCCNTNPQYLSKLAVRCEEREEFIEEEYIQDLYHGDTIHGSPFKCPTCDAHFAKLSSLFQHIDSSSCDQTLHDNGIDEFRRDLAYDLS